MHDTSWQFARRLLIGTLAVGFVAGWPMTVCGQVTPEQGDTGQAKDQESEPSVDEILEGFRRERVAAPEPPAVGTRPQVSSPTVTPAPIETPLRPGEQRSRDRISPDDILRQFENERPQAEPLLPRAPAGERVVRMPGERQSGPRRYPDGYFLVDRAGRLTRDGEWWVINFVADNNPTEYPDPPMRLLPNQMLERMVRESAGGTSSIEFIVSGEVTDFMGQNHLLLRKLLRRRNLGNLSL